MQLPEEFLLLAELFKNNGYDLYLVGGSSRDFLLEQEIEDFDLATNATISQMEQFLSFKTTYPKLSSGNLYFHKKKFDITTLRKEEEYEDYRHPSKIKFTTSLYEDSLRRDFTLNAIYIDDKNYIYDYHGGLNDLNK
jgi:tRNA nucleotidyltransferase/poly(A) polymerase